MCVAGVSKSQRLMNARVSTPVATHTRVGILPKRNEMGKRKLNEFAVRRLHALHSFSTGLLKCKFAKIVSEYAVKHLAAEGLHKRLAKVPVEKEWKTRSATRKGASGPQSFFRKYLVATIAPDFWVLARRLAPRVERDFYPAWRRRRFRRFPSRSASALARPRSRWLAARSLRAW